MGLKGLSIYSKEAAWCSIFRLCYMNWPLPLNYIKWNCKNVKYRESKNMFVFWCVYLRNPLLPSVDCTKILPCPSGSSETQLAQLADRPLRRFVPSQCRKAGALQEITHRQHDVICIANQLLWACSRPNRINITNSKLKILKRKNNWYEKE